MMEIKYPDSHLGKFLGGLSLNDGICFVCGRLGFGSAGRGLKVLNHHVFSSRVSDYTLTLCNECHLKAHGFRGVPPSFLTWRWGEELFFFTRTRNTILFDFFTAR